LTPIKAPDREPCEGCAAKSENEPMPPRTVLVHATTNDKGVALLKSAATLAAGAHAHLVALVVGIEPSVPYASLVDVPIDAYAQDLEEARDDTRRTVRQVEGVLARHSNAFEVRGATVPSGLVGAEVSRQARYADLSLFPVRNGNALAQQALDATLFGSGRPVLIVPAGAALDAVGRRVAVAWDGSREAARAVADALSMLSRGSEVHILVIDPVVAPEHHGEEPGADIATALSRHDLKVTVHAVPSAGRSVAGAVLEHARALDADLLVAGAYGHSRLREILIGGVTRELMEQTDRPLLMAH
jgi:nucleotide-binding universal stress UspA family protein